MRSLYIISYDLNNPGQDYTNLFKRIESLGNALHIQKSVWLLKSNLKAMDISTLLHNDMDKNDTLFVSELDVTNYNGWMNKNYWKWIKD